MKAQLSPGMALVRKAKKLVRKAPGDPDASRALGEAALAVYDAKVATGALEQLVAASPNDAEGHYLLGRARRMSADGAGAEVYWCWKLTE